MSNIPAPQTKAWDQMVRQVIEANPDVQDELDVAATIESMGYSDHQVAARFGYATVFELASDVYQQIIRTTRTEPLPPKPGIPWYVVGTRLMRDFVHGLAFGVPMVLSVAAMIILHISFQSYQYFSIFQATALGLATFLSFVVAGGFSQAMASSYYLLIGLQEAGLVERTLFTVMRWGFWCSVLLAGGILFADTFFPILPFGLVAFMSLYMVLLSVVWLAFATLYVLRKEYHLIYLTVAATLVAYILWQLGTPVILAQAAAMGCAAIGTVLLALQIFRRTSREWKMHGRIIKTRTSQLAYATAAYFLYGMLYFSFIYIDRLVAWTTDTATLPYTIWFRGQYELGMDWSLLTLILPLGAIEALTAYLVNWMTSEHQRTSQRSSVALGKALRAQYFRVLAVFLALSLAAVGLGNFALGFIEQIPSMAQSVPVQGVEPFVFTWSSVAYVMLALALFNVLLLFTLAYPGPALRSFAAACGVDFAVGLIATHALGSYADAVFGLLAGAAYLMVVSTIEVLRVITHTDFFVYRMS